MHKVHYTPLTITTRRPFFGTGWPARNPSKTCLVEVTEYRNQKYAWIACTQLGPPYKPADQKRIVQEWCDLFRQGTEIRELALRSRAPAKLFEAACQQQQLTRFHVKWGPVKDLSPLERLIQLEGLSLGTSGIEEIGVLSKLPRLRFLQLDNPKHIYDFQGLDKATSLEFLSLEGDWRAPRKIHVKDLEFVRDLHQLRALRVGCALINNFELTPLLNL